MSIGLWGEGDPLSPTNLNARAGGPLAAAKIYHVAWAAGTGTTQLNNAIVDAKANNYTGVFVDSTRLPYDASQVTFDATIHMFREGGSLRSDEFEPEAYGAHMDGVTDDWYSVMACAAAHNGTGGTIKLGRGTMFLSRPWVQQSDLRLSGVGSRGWFSSNTKPSYLQCQGGPALVLNGANTFGPLSAGIVAGTTNSFGNGAVLTQSQMIDLRECVSAELNGALFAAFCYEGYFQTTSVAANGFIAGSFGTDFDGVGHNAFFIKLVAGGSLQAKLNVGGSVKTISGGTILANTTYWFALTYDGSTVRLFYGTPGGTSSLIGSSAASGNVTQDTREQVIPFGTDPTFVDNNIPGYWGPLRLSNIARYTTTGTVPNGPFAYDGGAGSRQIVINFDLQDGNLTRALAANLSTGAASTWWYWLRQTVDVGTRHYIENIGFTGGTQQSSGLLVLSAQGSLFRGLVFQGCRDAYICYGSNFSITLDSPYFNLTGLRSIGILTDALHTIIDPNITNGCGRFGLYFGGSGGRVFGGYVVTGGITVCDVFVAQGAYVELYDTSLSFENFTATLETIALVAGHFRMFGGVIETQNSKPHVKMYNSGSYAAFQSTVFSLAGTAPASVFNVPSGGLTKQIALDECENATPGSFVPWSNVAGSVMVGPIGRGIAIPTTSTQTFDASLRDQFESTLTGNVSTSTLINVTPGQELNWLIKQDSTGSRLWTVPSAITWGTVGAVSIYTAANGWNQIDTVVGLDSKAYVRSFKTGP